MDFFWQVFEIHHVLVLFLGLLLGMFVGAMPGLTPTMGVALMIPFTFALGPTEGLILLGGIYCGSVFGGSIPAILFNVPGAPANVATTFDGYPMTKQGKCAGVSYDILGNWRIIWDVFVTFFCASIC